MAFTLRGLLDNEGISDSLMDVFIPEYALEIIHLLQIIDNSNAYSGIIVYPISTHSLYTNCYSPISLSSAIPLKSSLLV